jgi:hypothetical protein
MRLLLLLCNSFLSFCCLFSYFLWILLLWGSFNWRGIFLCYLFYETVFRDTWGEPIWFGFSWVDQTVDDTVLFGVFRIYFLLIGISGFDNFNFLMLPLIFMKDHHILFCTFWPIPVLTSHLPNLNIPITNLVFLYTSLNHFIRFPCDNNRSNNHSDKYEFHFLYVFNWFTFRLFSP